MAPVPGERLPPSERTLPALLRRQATRFGPRPLVADSRGAGRTFAEMPVRAAGMAARLAAAGIGPGDRVALLSENRIEVLDLWVGCAWLGAVLVPINTAARSLALGHILSDSGARLLAVEAELLPVLDLLEAPARALERLWVLDDDPGERAGLACERFPEPLPGVPPELTPAAPGPGDTTLILYTSGTTGPSKGVLCPQAQWYWWGVHTGAILGVGPDDVLYSCLPLFHTNALNTFMQALTSGARFVIGQRFSASGFWQRLTESQATVTYLLGAMVHILAGRPQDPFERAHSTRVALAPATPAALHAPFAERFGIRIVDGWGATETNVVLATGGTAAPPGSMGAIVPGFDARVVDADDEELAPGTPGELVVRAEEPFAFATGYHGLPEKTVEAWRNLWFHTGDRVVCDADGYFWFVDRIKEAIRRRGENISSFEVEGVLASHPDVTAAAVVAVPAEIGEDEVLACVVLREGAELDPLELIKYCEPRLAYFAVPRFVDVLPELPLTANGKIEKYRLRERGVTATTWDLETSGYRLERRLRHPAPG